MILLDHMDWLTPEQVQQEWSGFSKKLSPTTGRVLWRTFAAEQKFVSLNFLAYETRRVREVEGASPDRVGMYSSTFLTRLPCVSSVADLDTRQAVAGSERGQAVASCRHRLVGLLGRLS